MELEDNLLTEEPDVRGEQHAHLLCRRCPSQKIALGLTSFVQMLLRLDLGALLGWNFTWINFGIFILI